MSERTKNLKALFADTRSRTILLLTLAVVVFAIVLGSVLVSRIGGDEETSAQLTRVPGSIQSIPGGLNPTEQYATLQEEENISQAELAAESGRSAIPTVIRTQRVGTGEIVGVEEGEGGLGFTSLSQQERDGGLAKSLWLDELKESGCSRETVENALTEGLSWRDILEACHCGQLRAAGYSLAVLRDICSCVELKDGGVTAEEFRAANYPAGELRACGFDACTLRNAGYSARELCDGGFSPGELRGAGFSEEEIQAGCRIRGGALAATLREMDCDIGALRRAYAAGMSAAEIRRVSGCDVEALRAAGFTAEALRAAGFTAAELARAGFNADELTAAGFGEAEAALALAIEEADCSPAVLRQLRAAGVTAREIREDLGCDLAALKAAGFTAAELKEAGFTAAELKNAGFTASELKAAGFSADELREAGFSAEELKNAGFSPKELRDAGFTADELKNAGFSARALKEAGFSPEELRDAGFNATELRDAGLSARELKDAGFDASELRRAGYTADDLQVAGFNADELAKAGVSAEELRRAGFSPAELRAAGFSAEELRGAGVGETRASAQVAGVDRISSASDIDGLTVLPSIGGAGSSEDDRLEAILAQQAAQRSEQQLQQDITQRQSAMLGQANQILAQYGVVATQFYDVGTDAAAVAAAAAGGATGTGDALHDGDRGQSPGSGNRGSSDDAKIKAGDIIFGILDTAINSDEPGPILATIVSGRYKGARLIGSLTLPREGQKVILSFNSMSLPEADHTISINAVAIDPDTARTALSSRTDNHYLQRYGSLFASSFLEGFGQSFADVGTTISVDGSTTIITDAGRSARESAYAGLGTVGERWGNQLAPIFNRPPTVEVFAGTGLGILFTQDVTIESSLLGEDSNRQGQSHSPYDNF